MFPQLKIGLWPDPFPDLGVPVGKSEASSHIVIGGRPINHAEVGCSRSYGGEAGGINASVVFIYQHVGTGCTWCIEATHLVVGPPALTAAVTMVTV